MSDIVIRRVEQGDLPALLDIYNHYVLNTPITFDIEPRTLAQRQVWLDAVRSHRPLPVLRRGAWRHGDRLGLLGALQGAGGLRHLRRDQRLLRAGRTGRGLGRRLYATLFEALAGEDIHRAYGGITLPNAPPWRCTRRWASATSASSGSAEIRQVLGRGAV